MLKIVFFSSAPSFLYLFIFLVGDGGEQVLGELIFNFPCIEFSTESLLQSSCRFQILHRNFKKMDLYPKISSVITSCFDLIFQLLGLAKYLLPFADSVLPPTVFFILPQIKGYRETWSLILKLPWSRKWDKYDSYLRSFVTIRPNTLFYHLCHNS